MMKCRCNHVVKMQTHIKHVHDGEERPFRQRKRKRKASSSSEEESENEDIELPEEEKEQARSADLDLVTASEVKSDGKEVSSKGNPKVNRKKSTPVAATNPQSDLEFTIIASLQGGRQRKAKVIFDL